MMDLETIRAMNSDATSRAKHRGARPFVPAQDIRHALTVENMRQHIRIPMLGDYVPRGWEEVGDPLFCDKSGWGGEGEPALTARGLCEAIKTDAVDIGYGSHDEGQFQIYVSRYRQKVRRTSRKAPHVESLEERQDDLGLSPDY
jgi:hypothetical protein